MSNEPSYHISNEARIELHWVHYRTTFCWTTYYWKTSLYIVSSTRL